MATYEQALNRSNEAVFAGWVPIPESDVIREGDILVAVDGHYLGLSQYNTPSTRPPLSGQSYLGKPGWRDANKVNENFWPFRRIRTYNGMPEGIARDGWVPIPDDEMILDGDLLIYTDKSCCSVGWNLTGRTMNIVRDTMLGTAPNFWVFRQGAGFEPPKRFARTNLHPIHSRPLPLP